MKRGHIYTRLKATLICVGYHSRPQFLIIGAQKGGTVALRGYLSKHPNIMPASREEIHFFDQDVGYRKGEAWYHSHFPLPHRLGQQSITCDVTPSYLYYPVSAERIFSCDPYIKLIALLRDPVERAFSAWNMFRTLSHSEPEHLISIFREYYDEEVRDELVNMLFAGEFRGFTEAVRDEIDKILSGDPELKLEPSFVRRGLYCEQLLRYFKYFERDQILIIDSHLLRTNTPVVLDKVIQFLRLPEYNWQQTDLPLFHIGQYETQMPDEARALLREFYKPYNEKLYELLGRDFGWQ